MANSIKIKTELEWFAINESKPQIYKQCLVLIKSKILDEDIKHSQYEYMITPAVLTSGNEWMMIHDALEPDQEVIYWAYLSRINPFEILESSR